MRGPGAAEAGRPRPQRAASHRLVFSGGRAMSPSFRKRLPTSRRASLRGRTWGRVPLGEPPEGLQTTHPEKRP